MTDVAGIRRQLKIKSGVVKRLFKESTLYQAEVHQLEKKRDKFVEDGAEEWDVKNANKMIDESKKMVVDVTTRLGNAADELDNLITSAKEDGLAEDEELLKAAKVLEESRA